MHENVCADTTECTIPRKRKVKRCLLFSLSLLLRDIKRIVWELIVQREDQWVNNSLTGQRKPVIIVHQRKSFINTLDMIEKLLWNYWHNKSINIIVCGVFYVPFLPSSAHTIWNYGGVEQSKHFYCADRSDISDEDEDDEEMGSLLCGIFYDQLDATIVIT